MLNQMTRGGHLYLFSKTEQEVGIVETAKKPRTRSSCFQTVWVKK